MGYTPTETVEGAGQYSVRGYIIDIFPTKCEYTAKGKCKTDNLPIRIELFGDEIDRMVTFDIMTQRAIEPIDSFTITPSKEILPSSDQLSQIKEEIQTLLEANPDESAKKELTKELASLESDTSCPFFDRFISPMNV